MGHEGLGYIVSVALDFDGLSLGYEPRNPAVVDVKTQIQPGSLTALVGPNGAGKSTLLKGVVGALSPLAGNLSLDDCARDAIAYLPQQSDVDRSFPMSVQELVATGLWRETGAFGGIRRQHRELIAQALAAVGLQGFAKRPLSALSGGQMQRSLFARVLLQDAPLVLLDEPFAAIDAATLIDLIEVIQRWHHEGRTVLAVLHDIDIVREYFPETLLLARQLVAHGPTHDVLTAENQFRARQMCEACAGPPHTCGR